VNRELRRQIYNNMNLKETYELIEIWQTNNRFEWSDETFDVVREVLRDRAVEIPEQNKATYEKREEGDEYEADDFNQAELKIIDDDNPPDFYDPLDVLRLNRWIEWGIKSVAILYNLISFPTYKNIVGAYFPQSPNSTPVYAITFILTAINAGFGIIIYYFILKVFAQVLSILMEMEFRSRKAK
jgi:hypothetical protein